jgi:hypothetical protein
MHYRVAIIVSVILGATLITDGIVRTSRARQHVSMVKTNVSAMSQRQLAAGVGECDASPASTVSAKRDGDFCAEVTRALDDQPLQIVNVTQTRSDTHSIP